jgi:pre-mRNA-processing factor 6
MSFCAADAETCLSHEPASVHTARAVYSYSLEMFPKKKELWLAASVLEKDYGTPDSLETVLLSAVKSCPHAEILWLMAAKEKWLLGNVPGARAILLEAFELNPQSEQIWLAAVKLEWENNERKNAQALLNKAVSEDVSIAIINNNGIIKFFMLIVVQREMAPSPRVWLKSALLEREMGDARQALLFIDQAIKKYPTYAKFYMMAGQICSDQGGPGD